MIVVSKGLGKTVRGRYLPSSAGVGAEGACTDSSVAAFGAGGFDFAKDLKRLETSRLIGGGFVVVVFLEDEVDFASESEAVS